MRRVTGMFISAGLCLICACSHHQTPYLGYVEGRYVYLSSPVSGQLIQLAVQKGETVKTGQVAFQLDPQPESSELSAAKAQFQSAERDLENLKLGARETIIKRLEAQILQAHANVTYSKKMLDRNQSLRQTGAVSQAMLDQSRTTHQTDLQKLNEAQANLAEAKLGARTNLIEAQEAKVNAARASVEKYQWMVSQKNVVIPADGFVQDTLFRQNEFVPAGKPVIQFLPNQNRLLIFFIPEKKLSGIHLGQLISFTCDGCAKNLSATIDYISSRAQYTPPVIYSEESRSKLVYWIEASMDASTALKVNPGEPIEVFIQ
ncbi:MAG: hypothetical protein A3I77_00570 [Gammaproteobacteria bacterium RIFCSPLOWO2_02_FULL_42_14]|nr:MAG: hypothetical protein A3B71_08655 [Gammaproteobacteria bacterium RIFCSPHIGHO2_02_FULL_42_43]OGT50777.1 MAG: hypothetical protein A3E54_00850 [Gammaproteobacteria bacterium RIFCSPHIGHO2_12_FULL_41_25]OGT61762.1 MAG: hypothetical protein A3I77_00570 [Gammaproteobacteria bacterium RIFCSPLOWO2_02_FULL_42_14]OGT85506.1 MAG: hypothetical protein A3G86_06760 [Gammaproteobacteria bacterium RIFCSPLOWO2_12_FULL_42_18]